MERPWKPPAVTAAAPPLLWALGGREARSLAPALLQKTGASKRLFKAGMPSIMVIMVTRVDFIGPRVRVQGLGFRVQGLRFRV